uniref:Uncharacterized protein n=1 Tax=Ditylenchus dipsaci TaxID=166011 RepID=A0A915CT92_9BILA
MPDIIQMHNYLANSSIDGLVASLDYSPEQHFLTKRIEKVYTGLRNCASIQLLAEAVQMQLSLKTSASGTVEKKRVLDLLLSCFCQLLDKFTDEKLDHSKKASNLFITESSILSSP